MAMNLPFDVEAMVKPKTPADVLLALDEALHEIRSVNETLQRILDEPAAVDNL